MFRRINRDVLKVRNLFKVADRINLALYQQLVSRSEGNVSKIGQAVLPFAKNTDDSNIETRPESGMSDQFGYNGDTSVSVAF